MSNAWATVLEQIETIDDALALMSMFEYRDETLYANDSPITDLDIANEFISERGVAMLLAEHLTTRGEPTEYTDLYAPTRGYEAPEGAVEKLVARCRAAGVELGYHDLLS